MGLLDRIITFANTIWNQRTQQVQTNQGTLVTTEPASPKIKVYGSHGRLEIPELFISVPLYDAQSGYDRQRVVDNPDSAVYMKWQKQDAIADHASQANMTNLNLAKVGRTLAVIDQRNQKKTYRCVQSQVGHIRISPNGNRIFDANWNSANFQNEGGLCIYTCMHKSAEDVMDVRLTYWQPVNE